MIKAVYCYSAVNMSIVLVLLIICLSVILLSLQADAQPTAEETLSCSSTLQEVAIEIKNDIKDVKKLLASHQTTFDSTQPSKQALVSALMCEYPILFTFRFTVKHWFNRQEITSAF